MALKKQKTLADGNTGEYWRFSTVNYEEVIKGKISTRFDLTLWKDKDTKNTEGSIPLSAPGSQYNYTTDTDLSAVTVQALGLDASANVKDIIKKSLYADIKTRAATEALKDDEDKTKNFELAWFADALDI